MFTISERELGVTRLLDPEDVDTANPDEKSIITYLSSLYELFPEPASRHPLLEDEKMRAIEEYKETASRFVLWMKETTTRLRDRNWPNTPTDLRMIQTDNDRFRTEEIPPRLHEKQRLAHSFREVSKYALELDRPVMIDHELSADNIDILWSRMIAAHNERDQALLDEILRQEKLQRLADKVLRECKHCDLRLDDIDRRIIEEAKRIERVDPHEVKSSVDSIAADLKIEGDRIAELIKDVQVLLDNRYYRSNEVQTRVETLHKRWTDMGFIFRTRVIEALTKRKQDLESAARLRAQIEANLRNYLEDAARLVGWISKSTSILRERNWPNKSSDLKIIRDEHRRFRKQEVPPKLEEKIRLAQVYRDIQKQMHSLDTPIVIDSELSSEAIDIIWNRMMAASQEREQELEDEIARQEKLNDLADRILKECKASNLRMDEMDRRITDIARRVDKTDPKELRSSVDAIANDLKNEGDRIMDLKRDCKVLLDNDHHQASEVSSKVDSLYKRWNEMGITFTNKVLNAIDKRRTDLENQQRQRAQVEANLRNYLEDASRLASWMTKMTQQLKERNWGNKSSELKALMEELHRFRSKEVPPKMEEKTRLSIVYQEIIRTAKNLAEPMTIDSDLSSDVLENLWKQMMSALNDREKALNDEIARLEKLEQLADRILRECKSCDARLDGIDRKIIETAKKIDRADPQDLKIIADSVANEMKVESEKIKEMSKDCNILHENRYHKANEVQSRIDSLAKRLSDMEMIFRSKVLDALKKRMGDLERSAKLQAQVDANLRSYIEETTRLVSWITKSTSSMKDRNWDHKSSGLKQLLQDLQRFRSKEIPPRGEDKIRLNSLYKEIIKLSSQLESPVRVDDNLTPDSVDILWNKLMTAMNEREKILNDEWNRLEKLEQLADKILRECKQSHGRLDELDRRITDVSRKIETRDPRELKPTVDSIGSDIKIEGDRIQELFSDVQFLLENDYRDAKEVQSRVDSLMKRWRDMELNFKSRVIDALKRRMDDLDSAARRRAEVEANLRSYLEDATRLVSWISKSTVNLKDRNWSNNANELKLLQEELQRFMTKEIPVKSEEKTRLSLIYDEIQRQASSLDEPMTIDSDLSTEAIASLWQKMMAAAHERENDLTDVLELQDLLEWMSEMDARLATTKPVGGLPETAQEQLNKFMELYHEIMGMKEEVETILAAGANLDASSNLKSNLTLVKQQWEHLLNRANDRKVKLEIALREAIEFHEALQEFMEWLDSAEKHLANLPPVSRLLNNVRNQIEEHKIFQKDVSDHRETMLSLDKKGTHLKYFCQKQDVILIKNMMISVEHRWERVVSKTSERMRALEAALKETQEFFESWTELIQWLKEAERQLDDTSSGNSPDVIKRLLIKHKEFQRILGAKQSSYDSTMKLGRSLKDRAPRSDVCVLQEMLDELKSRWNSVCGKSVDRQRRLEESLLFSGQFKDAVDALIDWLDRAKLHLLPDRVHGDLDTVTSLVEQHRHFQEDMKSRSKQLTSVRKTASELLSSATAEDASVIRSQMSTLESKWEEIEKLSMEKEIKLEDALRMAEQLHKSVHSLLEFLSDAEMKLRSSNQLPDDEDGTRAQIAEHERIEREMSVKVHEKNKTIELAQEILSKCHPDAIATINHWISIIQSRWEEVSNWIKTREGQLRDHLNTLKGVTDLLDELMSWLRRKESELHAAESIPLPDDIPSIEQLIDEHQRFIDDLASRQSEIDRITHSFTKKVFEESTGRTSRAKGGRSPYTKTTTTTTTMTSMISNTRARELVEKYNYVWNLAQDRMRRLQERLQYITELERMKNFDFEEWRRRFLAYLNNRKAKIMDFYRRIDTDNDCKVTQNEFIEGFLKSSFPTSRLEMERVAPIFDRNGDGFIDHREYLETLRAQDYPRTEDEIIQDEVQKAVSKCTCQVRYKVFHVGEGKYRFGESQKLRLVRILRSTVMVRVGGGWVSLDEFLVKNDPCRGKFLKIYFVLHNRTKTHEF
jgi:Ca2+-binding EF-hand superfamily protein